MFVLEQVCAECQLERAILWAPVPERHYCVDCLQTVVDDLNEYVAAFKRFSED